MHQYKIEDYEAQFNKPFPEFESLNQRLGHDIISDLRANVPNADKRGNIFATLEDALDSQDYDAESIYDIAYIFSLYEFADEHPLYIIWDENQVDVMSKFPFINAWQTLWNPDDGVSVILYTPATQKVLMITPWGAVYSN